MKCPELRITILVSVISLYLVSSVNGQTTKEKVYVWGFSSNSESLKNTAERVTEYFEEALVEKACYQVQERQKFSNLLSQIRNEQAIGRLQDISVENRNTIQNVIGVSTVIFGKVDFDDEDSGAIRISVTFQKFDSTIAKKKYKV